MRTHSGEKPYQCQYCNNNFPKKELTVDHVLPLSHGGKTAWTNCVAACGPCNHSKSNKLHIKPISKPHKPGYYELVRKRKQQEIQVKHPSWNQWL